MDWKFICPSCGHETTYDPRDWPRFLQFVGPGSKKEVVVRRIRCAACGRETDVKEEQG
jgi:transcription elongation factor Elf1